MDLESIMLRDVNQTEEGKYLWALICGNLKQTNKKPTKLTDTDNSLMAAEVQGVKAVKKKKKINR